MEDNSSVFTSALTLALAHALDHLSLDDHRPVNAPASLATLRQNLDLPLNEASLGAKTVINDLVSGVDGGIIDSAGGRFFGWGIGGSLPAALAADWLTSPRGPKARLFALPPRRSRCRLAPPRLGPNRRPLRLLPRRSRRGRNSRPMAQRTPSSPRLR